MTTEIKTALSWCPSWSTPGKPCQLPLAVPQVKKYHKWKNRLFPTKPSASVQANKVCQLGQDVCSGGNTFEKIAEGCRWELKARNSAVQLCALKKFVEDLFYFFEDLFFENTWACVLGPWPRAFLSLASRGSFLGGAVLGLGLSFGLFLWPWPWPRTLYPRLHLW